MFLNSLVFFVRLVCVVVCYALLDFLLIIQFDVVPMIFVNIFYIPAKEKKKNG